ncbi:MAG: hypothetical protein QNI91_06760 [Arenicellales bacterium]|nr:hypothetical protein [Arenicellales bacterium]
MKPIRTFFATTMVALLFTSPVYAEREQFDTDKMLSDLESQLKLSGDKLDKLKPAMDAKSEELKKSIHESVDEGFMQLENLTTQLDAASKEAEAQLKEALSSEEMQQLKDYLNKIDAEAINQIRDELVAQLSEFLKLTEEQIAKVKPILEDSFNQLGELLDQLVREGGKSLEKFKSQFDQLNEELKQKLRDNLNPEQIKSLDTNREELRQNIKQALDLS